MKFKPFVVVNFMYQLDWVMGAQIFGSVCGAISGGDSHLIWQNQ